MGNASNTATEFGKKLQNVIQENNFYLKSYVWKEKKVKTESGFIQREVVLMDCDESELKGYYNHCISMLYNHDRTNPGRYPLIQIIQSQKDRCGVELYLRGEEANGISRFSIVDSIKQAVRYSGITQDQFKTMTLSEFVTVDSQYTNLPIKLIQEGCLQRLGKFDKSHITLTFILKQGVKLTENEEKELTEYIQKPDGQSKRDVIEVIRERLNIADHMPLALNSKGLTYSQQRAMLNLKSRYYNELTVEQLKTLRYRILFSLEDNVLFHIQQWETRLSQIKEVAKARNIELDIQV